MENKKNIIIISSILGAIIILYFLSISYISSSIFIISLLTLLQIYSILVISGFKFKEDFHFEVSPEKQKCMEENVSLEQPPGVRSPECCPVYTTGGTLKYVDEWKENKYNNIHWPRTDNWVNSKDYNTYQTQLAPTSYVGVDN